MLIGDVIINRLIGIKEGLLKELIASFFRAALLEEFFKFFGFMRANKEYHFSNEKEYMLGAGMVGLAYGIIEKVFTGNAMAIILGIILIINCVTQVSSAISSNAKTIVDGIIDKVIYPGDIDIDSVNSITGGIVFGPIE